MNLFSSGSVLENQTASTTPAHSLRRTTFERSPLPTTAMRRFCTVPRGRRPSVLNGGHDQPRPPPEWIEPYTDLADPSPYTVASATPPTPSPWLPRVVSLVLRAPPATLAADLRAFCSTFLLRLSPAFVAAALRSPQLLTYNCLLDGLVNAGLLDTAINVFDAMSTEDRVRPDVVSFNILIKGYCRSGRAQDAMARLDHMREQAGELSPDKVTYLTLI